MKIALWELCNVIFKLGFSRAFDEAVNGDTENSICTEYCRVLLSFFRGNQKVCSSSSGCNAQFHLFSKCGVGPGIHINQQIRSFLVGPKFEQQNRKFIFLPIA